VNHQPIILSNKSVQETPIQVEKVANPLPTLWSQLGATQKKQLAQNLAELIRRIRIQSTFLEETFDERP